MKNLLSEDFTVEDIRKIREYDTERMDGWTDEEIIKDTQDKVRELLEYLEQNKPKSHINLNAFQTLPARSIN